MRINQLIIRNFKGFGEREFSFGKDPDDPEQGSFHVLIGENGSGKSTALDAMAVALGIWHVASPSAGWRAIRPEEARFQVTRTGDQQRFDPMPSPGITAKGVIQGKTVSWTRENRDHSKRTSNAGAKEAIAVIKEVLAANQRQVEVSLPVLAYYGAGRAWLSGKERASKFELKLGKVSRYDAYYYCLDGSIRHRDINRWFLFESLQAFQSGMKRTGMRAVEDSVLSCVPGATHLRFDADRKEIIVGFTDREIPFYSLSDGQRSMVSMVADIAMKAAILNPHLGRECAKASPGVVLIDELDLHLHPTWQRKVVEYLRTAFPNIQFVGTTHSPFVVQTLRAGELISLDSQPIPETGNVGIESIARGLMGVERPEVSPRYREMKQAARHYLLELEEAGHSPAVQLREFEAKLAEGIAPYADNPAFQAFLELKREGALSRHRGTGNGTMQAH